MLEHVQKEHTAKFSSPLIFKAAREVFSFMNMCDVPFINDGLYRAIYSICLQRNKAGANRQDETSLIY